VSVFDVVTDCPLRMPSAVHPTSLQKSHVIPAKKKFRTVLGAVFKDSDSDTQVTPTAAVGRNVTFARKSIDTARSYNYRRKHRTDRSSVADTSFFQPKSTNNTAHSHNQAPVIDTSDNMKTFDTTRPRPSSRRPPVRMDAQDGPWSISVAETPHDSRSYSLYIKSEFFNYYVYFLSIIYRHTISFVPRLFHLPNPCLVTCHHRYTTFGFIHH